MFVSYLFVFANFYGSQYVPCGMFLRSHSYEIVTSYYLVVKRCDLVITRYYLVVTICTSRSYEMRSRSYEIPSRSYEIHIIIIS